MPSIAELEAKANKVLADYGNDQVPVNPTAVANFLGYEVKAAGFRDMKSSGRIRFENGRICIYVNAWDPPNRRRFTIAHEIGHAILHTEGWGGAASFDITDRNTDQDIAEREFSLARQTHEGLRPVREVEADRFAAAMLMPRSWLTERFKHDQNVASLAKHFEVSQAAMEIRLKQLGLAH